MKDYERRRKALKGEYINDKKELKKKRTGRTKLPKTTIEKLLTVTE